MTEAEKWINNFMEVANDPSCINKLPCIFFSEQDMEDYYRKIELLKTIDKVKSFIYNPYPSCNIKWFNSKIARLKSFHDNKEAIRNIKEREFAVFVPLKPPTACRLIITADKEDNIYQNGWHQLDWI